MATVVIVAAGLTLLFLASLLGAADSRDGRDWQARSDWPARHEGD